MKKLLIILFCLISIVCNAQYIDEIKNISRFPIVEHNDGYTTFEVPQCIDTIINFKHITQINYETITIPTVIYRDYKVGKACGSAGVVSLCIGIPTLIGGICCTYMDKPICGYSLIGTGASLIVVGIPLCGFGHIMKREANTNYLLFDDYK